jgi:hypothetical protein
MKLVVLVNALNIVDAIQTHVCLNYCSYCVEWNVLMYNPLMLYIAKPLIVLAWSLVLYRASMSENKLIAKTARAMLMLLALIFLVAVVNNVLVILSARC